MPPESPPPEPVAAWNRWLSESERQWNAFFNATMGTPQFAARLGESLDAYLGLAAVGQQFGAPALIASNLPTRSDLQELNDRLITLDGRLAQIEIRLAELAATRNGQTHLPLRESADPPERRVEGGAAGETRDKAARSHFASLRSNGVLAAPAALTALTAAVLIAVALLVSGEGSGAPEVVAGEGPGAAERTSVAQTEAPPLQEPPARAPVAAESPAASAPAPPVEASALETDDADPGDGAAAADTLPAARADAGTDAANATSVVERVLQTGETLEAVAAIFGTTVVALAAENQIDDIQTVPAGQVLRISVAGEVVVWVVEDGDTLTGLARRFETTIASLVAINGLADGDALSVGQRLTILPGR